MEPTLSKLNFRILFGINIINLTTPCFKEDSDFNNVNTRFSR